MENLEKHLLNIPLSTDESLYDLSMLTAMAGDTFVAEILIIFLRETPVTLEEMKEALNEKKYQILGQKAHKLKGSAGVLQAVKLIHLLEEIEIISKLEGYNNELNKLVKSAQQQYDCIEQSLKNYINTLG